MINPVNNLQSTNMLEKYRRQRQKLLSDQSNKSLTNNIKTSIFYVNDYHGKAMNMERTVTASNEFDKYVSSEEVDKLKLSSGDILLGENPQVNHVAATFLKLIGVSASAVGNHECDMKSSIFKTIIPEFSFKLLACNLKPVNNQNPLAQKVEKSIIEEHNGHKYGIIGVLPTDLLSRVKYGKVLQDQQIDPVSIEETIKDIQTEVNKLKSQGVNKIILLSHSGYGYDRKIARETDGVDIILGGHSHNLIEGIKEGENLLYSKSGEPVVITQAGRDGKNFGILNLEFDENGIIKKVQNNVATTRKFTRNVFARHIFEKILGKPEVIGEIRTAPPVLTNDLIQPNPLAYYGLDAIRERTGADIAIVGAANIRGYVEKGKIDTRTIEEISPFKNKILKINYTEKEIVDALKFGAKSFVNRNNKPGIMYVSGMKYTISQNGQIYDLKYINKNGIEEDINIVNPRKDKIYSVAINDYYSSGNDDLAMLNKIDQATARYDYDLNECIEYKIKNTNGPVDMVDDGRIRIVD